MEENEEFLGESDMELLIPLIFAHFLVDPQDPACNSPDFPQIRSYS